MRLLIVSSGLALAGAAGAGAWAVGAARAPSFASLLSSVGWERAGTPPPPSYQVRLELPNAPRAGNEGALSRQLPAALTSTEPAQELALAASAPREQPPPAIKAAASRSGILDMRFDIASFGKLPPAAGDGAVRASKPLKHGGKNVGSIDLSFGHGSIVAVDRRALQSLIGADDEEVAAALAGMEGEMVSFDALRDRGIRIRYDALSDAVVIEGGS